jgi:hypothetical protein
MVYPPPPYLKEIRGSNYVYSRGSNYVYSGDSAWLVVTTQRSVYSVLYIAKYLIDLINALILQ